MPTQEKRSWVLLTSLAACAGLATTPVFAVEPHALVRFVQMGDVQTVSSRVVTIEGANSGDLKSSDNAREIYLIKLLESSTEFRVRAQAAIALGMVENSLAARGALTAALGDSHPAVRAAAAISLGRIGDANHVVALRQLERDPEQPVRNAARLSITKLAITLEESPLVLKPAATTAALSANTNATRL